MKNKMDLRFLVNSGGTAPATSPPLDPFPLFLRRNWQEPGACTAPSMNGRSQVSAFVHLLDWGIWEAILVDSLSISFLPGSWKVSFHLIGQYGNFPSVLFSFTKVTFIQLPTLKLTRVLKEGTTREREEGGSERSLWSKFTLGCLIFSLKTVKSLPLRSCEQNT